MTSLPKSADLIIVMQFFIKSKITYSTLDICQVISLLDQLFRKKQGWVSFYQPPPHFGEYGLDPIE